MGVKDYYDSKMAELQLLMDALAQERRDVLGSSDPVKGYVVSMSENNSGGRFWLKKEDYKRLREDGFKVYPEARGIVWETKARSEAAALAEAKAKFNGATSTDADEEGCNCCGQPFYFDVEPEGEMPYWADTTNEFVARYDPVTLDD